MGQNQVSSPNRETTSKCSRQEMPSPKTGFRNTHTQNNGGRSWKVRHTKYRDEEKEEHTQRLKRDR